MPKKTKGRFPYNKAARPFNKYNNGSEVFRNASAVSDDTDPHQSLKYLVEIFHGKIDDDVIAMVFSECAFNGASVNRTVEIDLDFAKLIYDKWKSTVKKTTEPANKIKENKKQSLDEKIKQKISALQTSKDSPMSFSGFMHLEYALQVYKTQKLKKDTDFSTKLRRIELYNMFPGADTIALDEIFESNNYNLKNSVLALGEDLGEPITIRKESEAQNIKECLEEWNKLNVLKEFESNDWSGCVCPEESNDVDDEDTDSTSFTSTISPHAEGLRKKAAEHYVLCQESIQKAQNAHCKGMKEVASFYAQEGNKHGWKFKELNKEASKLILQERNSALPPQVLDLHGLHVQEAIPCLESFLKAEKQRKAQNGLTKLSVITGQGLHSVRGPKLRSSVVEFLKSAGYGFAEVNLGVLEVYLKPD